MHPASPALTPERPVVTLARYYDPSTGQFLTIDPKVATTLSPYGYVQGDPLNQTDAAGLSGGYGVPQNLVRHTAGPPACFRNPFGGNNGNGGCETPLSTSEGGLALSIVAVLGSGGALAAPEGVAGTALGWASVGAGGLGTAADVGPCSQGNAEACAAVGLGSLALGGGSAALLGLAGTAWAWAAYIAGAAAATIDIIRSLEPSVTAAWSCSNP